MILKPYVFEKTAIEIALNANECVWLIHVEAFIADLGHPLWGSQLMQDLASLTRKGRTLLIPCVNSCIDSEPHKRWPRSTMNTSIHQTHSVSFAFSAISTCASSIPTSIKVEGRRIFMKVNIFFNLCTVPLDSFTVVTSQILAQFHLRGRHTRN